MDAALTLLRPTGGATAKQPATWDNNDLAVYFTRTASFTKVRAATRIIPTGTLAPSIGATPKNTNVGAIAGGVIGGLAVLGIILSLILLCLYRRKKARKNKGAKGIVSLSPVELAATSPVHEMSSPGSTKYISMTQQPDMNSHPIYSGSASIHSRSLSNEHRTPTSPYTSQAYHSTSPISPAPIPSPYSTDHSYSNHQHHNTYQDYPNNPPYNPQQMPYDDPLTYPPTNAPHQPTYPNPTSSTLQQSLPYQKQVYYPPPPERTHPLGFSSRKSLEEIQHRGGTEPPSTTNTPAQFYAQPAPLHLQYVGEQTRDNSRPHSDTGSVGSGRRPVMGRFVEVGNL